MSVNSYHPWATSACLSSCCCIFIHICFSLSSLQSQISGIVEMTSKSVNQNSTRFCRTWAAFLKRSIIMGTKTTYNHVAVSVIIMGLVIQEWDSAEEKLLRGWSLWNDMPHSSRAELHIHPPNEGPNRKLLLLPFSRIPQGCWWFWWYQDPQSAFNPRPLRQPCWWLYRPNWRLVQS